MIKWIIRFILDIIIGKGKSDEQILKEKQKGFDVSESYVNALDSEIVRRRRKIDKEAE